MSLSWKREEEVPASKRSVSGEHGTKSKRPIKQKRPASRLPSCVSMKSDQSMDPLIYFREGDFSTEQRYKGNVAHLVNRAEIHIHRQTGRNWISSTTSPIKQERPASPVPSCVSMKSDWSMIQPISFREGDLSTEQRGQFSKMSLSGEREEGGPASKMRLSGTHDNKAKRGQFSKMSLSGEREEGGPASKMRLSGTHDNKAKSPIKQERPASPVPSCVSMKRDTS
ncbi:uncharacterized protein LOC115191155 [Salmo trutta]|uniref:uncharacterized protein LOC115191155 n=1 Tax=Salmo trutta TaxID=8032 RepID=UPI001130443B|nr:uncharacterized protein LOC115191155 [Salmo trutta]